MRQLIIQFVADDVHCCQIGGGKNQFIASRDKRIERVRRSAHGPVLNIAAVVGVEEFQCGYAVINREINVGVVCIQTSHTVAGKKEEVVGHKVGALKAKG